MKIKSIIIVISIVYIFLFGCVQNQCLKTQYIIETSNGLEKDGIIIQKNKWLFIGNSVRVIEISTNEVVVHKGYNPYYTLGDTFMLYGIIESDNKSETYILMRFDKNKFKFEYM